MKIKKDGFQDAHGVNKKPIRLEDGEGDIIIDVDVPSRTVADKYIEDIKRMRELKNTKPKIITYDDDVSVELVEYIKGETLCVTKVRFKGL